MKPLHELDALCAEKVAGLNPFYDKGGLPPRWIYKKNGLGQRLNVPPYTTDPAAVLGLLEKATAFCSFEFISRDQWLCTITHAAPNPEGCESFEAAGTFALAATLALLKAHGCEVGE